MFHSLGTETVNEPVQNDVLVFGTINEPFSDDLRFLLYAIAVGVSKSDKSELDCFRPCMSKQPCFN